jgi:hypothetical protein
MRKLLPHLALVFLLTPGCTAAWGERELQRDERFGHHEIPRGSSVMVGPHGELNWAVLKRPAAVAGVDFPAGSTLHFDAEERLFTAEFSERTYFGSLPVAPGYVEFWPTGVPKQMSLTERTEYRGYGLETFGTVELYADGGLKAASLGAAPGGLAQLAVDSMVVDNPELPLYTGWATFHANGRIRQAFPTRVHEVDGLAYASSYRMDFFRNGDVDGAVLAPGKGPRTIQGVPCRSNQPVWFHQNGELRHCVLDESAVLDGDGYPAGLGVAFDESGRVVEWASMDTYLNLAELPYGTIRRSGSEEEGYWRTRLRRSVTINDYPCQGESDWDGGDLEFDEYGNMLWCVLARDVRINKVIVAAGSQLSFAQGKPSEAYVRRMHTTETGLCGPDATIAFDSGHATCGWVGLDSLEEH